MISIRGSYIIGKSLKSNQPSINTDFYYETHLIELKKRFKELAIMNDRYKLIEFKNAAKCTFYCWHIAYVWHW